MCKNKVVLLCSGGIDSTVLLHRLIAEHNEVFPIYIDYGQITRKGELKAISELFPHEIYKRLLILNTPDIKKIGAGSLMGESPPDIGSKEAWFKKEFFPNRNMMLISLGAAYCAKIGSKNVAIGVVGQDSYPDTSRKFINDLNIVLGYSLSSVQIVAPYAGQSRSIVIQDAMRFRVPLDKTYSCNSLAARHCLLCTSCREREQAIMSMQLTQEEK